MYAPQGILYITKTGKRNLFLK